MNYESHTNVYIRLPATLWTAYKKCVLYFFYEKTYTINYNINDCRYMYEFVNAHKALTKVFLVCCVISNIYKTVKITILYKYNIAYPYTIDYCMVISRYN